jgi:arabinose-5-phosphate isomerase
MNQIFQQAIEVIDNQLSALSSMRMRMGMEVVRAVDLILNARGRVVVSGMGKSGIIGKKIAATLASTGTTAFYVHPGEAFYGDLGMIRGIDVALLISNSGETEEIVRILPYLHDQKNKVVAMTGKMDSISCSICRCCFGRWS